MSTVGAVIENVVVTGIGLVTSVGWGRAENWRAFSAGHSGVSQISRFPTDGLRTTIAATVEIPGDQGLAPVERAERIAVAAIEEALTESALSPPDRRRAPLVLALPPVQLEWPDRLRLAADLPADSQSYAGLLAAHRDRILPAIHARSLSATTAERLIERFGLAGVPITVNTACSSGATAVQIATEAIRRGDCEIAIAVGTDASVAPEMLTRFSLLSAMSRRNDSPETASRPFDLDRDGFVAGEGAAALVLESRASAKARRAQVIGTITGLGESADGHHRTRSHPSGKPAANAMISALRDAGLEPDEIDYISAHGTSTPENDRMEAISCGLVFGERVSRLPISSLKSMVGHTLSAAGAIEAAAALMSLERGTILPSINRQTPDPDIALDIVADGPRHAPIAHVLSNSFGFGGQNVCLVLSADT